MKPKFVITKGVLIMKKEFVITTDKNERVATLQISDKARATVPTIANALQEAYNEQIVAAMHADKDGHHKYLTDMQEARVKSGKFGIEHYAKNIVNKVNKGYLAGMIDRLNKVMATDSTVKLVQLVTEWTRGGVYGAQAQTTAGYYLDDANVAPAYKKIVGDKTGGYGYDKYSTALASALNSCDELMKAVYIATEKALQTADKNSDMYGDGRHLLGYGLSYFKGYLPYFDGGVGAGCFWSVLAKVGYKLTANYETKTSNVVTLTKVTD